MGGYLGLRIDVVRISNSVVNLCRRNCNHLVSERDHFSIVISAQGRHEVTFCFGPRGGEGSPARSLRRGAVGEL